jgi:hypothetical protein
MGESRWELVGGSCHTGCNDEGVVRDPEKHRHVRYHDSPEIRLSLQEPLRAFRDYLIDDESGDRFPSVYMLVVISTHYDGYYASPLLPPSKYYSYLRQHVWENYKVPSQLLWSTVHRPTRTSGQTPDPGAKFDFTIGSKKSPTVPRR